MAPGCFLSSLGKSASDGDGASRCKMEKTQRAPKSIYNSAVLAIHKGLEFGVWVTKWQNICPQVFEPSVPSCRHERMDARMALSGV